MIEVFIMFLCNNELSKIINCDLLHVCSTEEAFGAKLRIPFIYPQTFYKLTKMARDEEKAQKVLKEMALGAFEKRKQSVNSDASKLHDFTDLLIINEENLNEIAIRDHINSLMSSYEVSVSSMSHTMLLLAMHGEVQEKLFQELKNEVGCESAVIMDQNVIKNCEYLDMVYKESSRLLTTIPIISRETMDDFEIEDGVVVPKGVSLIMNLFALHRNKKFWGEDAEEFKPERFSKENSENRPPNIYYPFSAGPRICFGYKFSLIFFKIFIARLILKYKFETTLKLENLEFKSFMSMKLCGPHLVSIKRRSDL